METIVCRTESAAAQMALDRNADLTASVVARNRVKAALSMDCQRTSAETLRSGTYPAWATTSRSVDGSKLLCASYATSVSLDALLGVGATVGMELWLELEDS